MDLQHNRNDPRIMHVDLNSAFATVEQQANPLLRGKPIVVAAYNLPNGCVVSPSIEAKYQYEGRNYSGSGIDASIAVFGE